MTHRPNNIQVNTHKTVKYGDKSLRTLGPQIWNSLPEHIKNETDYIKFKEYISQLFGPICKCNLCVFLNKYLRKKFYRKNDLGFDPFNENGFNIFVFLVFSCMYIEFYYLFVDYF